MIDTNDLTCIIVAENDCGLINYAIQSIVKFSVPCPKIIVCQNSGNIRVKAAEIKPIIKHEMVSIIQNPLGHEPCNTSVRHGLGLNKLMGEVRTKYTAIVESDMCILSKDWLNLDTGKYDVKAALRGKKDIDYWFVCFLLFKTEIFKDMDWCPDKQRELISKSHNIYNDTGWRMSDKINITNARIKIMNVAKSDQIKYFNKNFHPKTLEFHEDGNPVAAHFGRGSDLARIKDYNSVLYNWNKICSEILEIDDKSASKLYTNIQTRSKRKSWKIGNKKKLK